ncbi:MAG: alpha/beta hydrolase [Bacteroidota bacterium]
MPIDPKTKYLPLGYGLLLFFLAAGSTLSGRPQDAASNGYKVAQTSYGSIRYVEIGPADGEVVLFSTGGGAGYNALYSIEWLAQAGFRVIAINRPGYYDLPLSTVNSIEEHADIYHAVIQFLGIKGKINVFGISMGGISALYYAQKYPTQSLVLWSAVTGEYQINQESADSSLGKLVMSDSGKRLISWMLVKSAKLFPKKTIETFLETEADLDKKGRRDLAKQVVSKPESKREFLLFVEALTPMDSLYTGMMDELVKTEALKGVDWSNISCPTFAVHSTIDIDVSIDHARRIEKMIPNIQMKYVEAGGHFVWWGDEGQTVINQTIDFLKQ